jgi:hypothetical protein
VAASWSDSPLSEESRDLRAVGSRIEVTAVEVAFFHNSDPGRVVAFYPSPAGATESLPSLEVDPP